MTWVEHIIPQSHDETIRNDYRNCAYSCRFCNSARSNNPVQHGSKRLLDPTAVAWADHFEVDEDHLRPKDPNAEYTQQCYDINEPCKARMRNLRMAFINDRRRLLVETTGEEAWLTAEAEQNQGDPEKMAKFLAFAQRTRRHRLNAIQELLQFRSVPEDAPTFCRCEDANEHLLPKWLEEQTWELEEIAS
ncbi:MAG: HNH endonuclease [Planctomycetia bacterium]|nr:HNH endonuclease [Planctomycetia bacterium]